MKHVRLFSLGLSCLLMAGTLSACKADGKTSVGGTAEDVTVKVGGQVIEPVTGNALDSTEPETAPTIVPAEAPTTGTYAPTSETLIMLGEHITVSGEGATAEGATVTVTSAGAYLISGTLEGGQIVVDTADDQKVTLILNGVSVTCGDGPAILIKSAPKKVVIYTAKDSVNLLSDAAGYIVPDEEQVEGGIYPNACLYACEDLELDGLGELHIRGNADKGINTKDDLKIKGGVLAVTASGVGIRANDSLTFSGGTLAVTAGCDGVKTANVETEGKGWILVEGGSLSVTAKGDGLSAATDLSISGGSLVLTTTDTDGKVLEESTENPSGSTGGFGGGGFGGGGFGGERPGGMHGESEADKSDISAKGLKAAGMLTVSGGRITVVAQDDGLHSDKGVLISDGRIHIRAADDGIHAEGELTISGGVTEVAQSYEGLEALHIRILGGTNRITASDDGANATDGSGGGMMGGPGGGFGGGRPGGMSGGASDGTTASKDAPTLTFAGGYSVFNAAGDGIDSNGNIVMTGGTVLVYGPTDNGNGPIDFGDGAYGMTISGGTFLAVGSSGMAETAENAGQAVLAAYWRSGLPAGETIGILNADGKVLAAFELPKAISSIVFSSPELVAGQTYRVVGGGTAEGAVTDGVIDPATYTGYEAMGEIEAY